MRDIPQFDFLNVTSRHDPSSHVIVSIRCLNWIDSRSRIRERHPEGIEIWMSLLEERKEHIQWTSYFSQKNLIQTFFTIVIFLSLKMFSIFIKRIWPWRLNNHTFWSFSEIFGSRLIILFVKIICDRSQNYCKDYFIFKMTWILS